MSIIRRRFHIVLVLAVTIVTAGFLMEWLLSFWVGTKFGHTQTGHQTGWIGLLFILAVFIYSIKKHSGTARWPKRWFLVHQIVGILGPVIILVHSGMHFHALIPLLAMLVMWLVVISGVIGVFVHRKAIGLLKEQRKTLITQDFAREQIDNKIIDLAANEKTFRVWQHIHAPMVILFVTLTLAHVAGALYFGGL